MPISIFPVLSHGKLLTLLDQSWNCDAESLTQHWRAKSLQDAAECSIAESRVVLVTPTAPHRNVFTVASCAYRGTRPRLERRSADLEPWYCMSQSQKSCRIIVILTSQSTLRTEKPPECLQPNQKHYLRAESERPQPARH